MDIEDNISPKEFLCCTWYPKLTKSVPTRGTPQDMTWLMLWNFNECHKINSCWPQMSSQFLLGDFVSYPKAEF